MATSEPSYKNLARSRLGLVGLGSLWLGPDHLLMVNNTFYVENYRRWYFNEIQTLVARRTSRRLILNLIFGFGCALLVLLCGGLTYGLVDSKGSDHDALIVALCIFGVLTLGCLAFVIVNTLLGPTCVIHVQTPRGTETLSLPNRLGAYHKLLARIQPMIQAIQTAQPASGESSGSASPAGSPLV